MTNKDLLQRHNVFICPDCNIEVSLSNRDLWKAQSYGGPYCPKCGKCIQKSLHRFPTAQVNKK